MKCPFELPVSKELMQNSATFIDGKTKLFRIKPLLIPYTEEEADYIVQVINSHRKLEQYKEYVESKISDCKMPNEWLPLCFTEWDKCVSNLAKDLEQALKESEKK